MLRSLAPHWQVVVEDFDRRSFCYVQRRTWPEELLQQEFQSLLDSGNWEKLHSKAGSVTRSTAWYVSDGCCCSYSYGDVAVQPGKRPECLRSIEARVLGEACGIPESRWPDCVNMNLYEDEAQNVGWHSDDEGLFRGCETDCRIISASWGASRVFEVALKDRKHSSGKPSVFQDTLRSVTLDTGNVCSMEGLFQRHYSHQLAKGAAGDSSPSALSPQSDRSLGSSAGGARINLTWRYIVCHKPYCPLSKSVSTK